MSSKNVSASDKNKQLLPAEIDESKDNLNASDSISANTTLIGSLQNEVAEKIKLMLDVMSKKKSINKEQFAHLKETLRDMDTTFTSLGKNINSHLEMLENVENIETVTSIFNNLESIKNLKGAIDRNIKYMLEEFVSKLLQGDGQVFITPFSKDKLVVLKDSTLQWKDELTQIKEATDQERYYIESFITEEKRQKEIKERHEVDKKFQEVEKKILDLAENNHFIYCPLAEFVQKLQEYFNHCDVKITLSKEVIYQLKKSLIDVDFNKLIETASRIKKETRWEGALVFHNLSMSFNDKEYPYVGPDSDISYSDWRYPNLNTKNSIYGFFNSTYDSHREMEQYSSISRNLSLFERIYVPFAGF